MNRGRTADAACNRVYGRDGIQRAFAQSPTVNNNTLDGDKPLGIAEEITVQREDVLDKPSKLFEIQRGSPAPFEIIADRIDYPPMNLGAWPDKEALLYDALRYLSQQVDIWRRQLDAE